MTQNKRTRTIHVEVILSSGTTQLTRDYVIHEAETFACYEHYYYIATADKVYYFPIERTIIKTDIIK
jgi:hypothetical protein